ncbi:hypothetical protein Calla_1654 [Caldicellulosiruptor acetigenus 6A]|uniref:Uncharacterized protein n=1 Tax=Caldicellulosiruptor acetigenus 6A TaxID=632516 RepID=G2PT91_9FIRM|nr:hypothetical protein Calla_1654 [Caldicellulosiruptor acetigenus 6A]
MQVAQLLCEHGAYESLSPVVCVTSIESGVRRSTRHRETTAVCIVAAKQLELYRRRLFQMLSTSSRERFTRGVIKDDGNKCNEGVAQDKRANI